MRGLIIRKLIAFVLVIALAVPVTPAFAAGTSGLELTVNNGQGKKAVAPSGISIAANGRALEAGPNGLFKSNPNDLERGNYAIVITDTYEAGQTVTFTTYVAVNSSLVKKTINYVNRSNVVAAKQGAIGGRVVDGNGDPLGGVAVQVKNAAGTWSTESGTDGSFKFYLPAGKYSLWVDGDGAGFKNKLYSLSVTAGHTISPFVAMNAKEAWAPGEEKLGFSLTTPVTMNAIENKTLDFAGKANVGTTVTLSDFDSGKVLATAKSVKPKTGNVGDFKIKLSAYPAGRKLKFTVTDEAGNAYNEISQQLDKFNVTAAADASDNTFGSAIDIPLTLPDGVKLSSVLSSTYSATSATYAIVAVDGKVLSNKQYSISAAGSGGKLTIGAGVLDIGMHTISIENGLVSINDVSQEIVASTKTPPLLNMTSVKAAAANASNLGDVKLKPPTGVTITNSVYYVVYSSTLAAADEPKLGTSFSGTVDYSRAVQLGTDMIVSAADAVYNKYIRLYEVTPAGAVAKYQKFTLEKDLVKGTNISPTIDPQASVTVNENTYKVVLSVSDSVYRVATSDALFKAAVKIKYGTDLPSALSTTQGDTVAIEGNKIIVTFTPTKNKSPYAVVISANALQDRYANKITFIYTSNSFAPEP